MCIELVHNETVTDSGNLAKSDISCAHDYASLIVDVLIAARDLENVPTAGK